MDHIEPVAVCFEVFERVPLVERVTVFRLRLDVHARNGESSAGIALGSPASETEQIEQER